jgi:hypothetical protein
MNTIDVFYQGNGIASVEHVDIESNQTFAALKQLIAKKHGIADDALLYLEDDDDAVDERLSVGTRAGHAGIKAHLHRCRKIRVTVHFKEKSLHQEFAPGVTVARVKRWAAGKLRMSEEDASNHHLQLAGTTEQPDPGTHIGRLAACPKCAVGFDLVPTPRVNGAE